MEFCKCVFVGVSNFERKGSKACLCDDVFSRPSAVAAAVAVLLDLFRCHHKICTHIIGVQLLICVCGVGGREEVGGSEVGKETFRILFYNQQRY